MVVVVIAAVVVVVVCALVEEMAGVVVEVDVGMAGVVVVELDKGEASGRSASSDLD